MTLRAGTPMNMCLKMHLQMLVRCWRSSRRAWGGSSGETHASELHGTIGGVDGGKPVRSPASDCRRGNA